MTTRGKDESLDLSGIFVAMLVVLAVVAIVLFLLWKPFGVFSNSEDKIVYVTPSSAPAATTAPATPAPAVVVPINEIGTCPGDHEVSSGETYDVPAGCNVKGDVQVLVNGTYVEEYDDDPATGLIVSCPHGCNVKALWGANVTPRAVDDLKTEMLSSGCGSECSSVQVVVIDGKDTNVQVTDLCDVSLPKGTTATVPDGCVVSGDVAVNGKALYDSDQTTGLVVVVTSPAEVFAPYGASVTNADPQDVVDAVKQTGCGLPNGCETVEVVTVP